MEPKFLELFLESTEKFGALYGPVMRNGILTFDRAQNAAEMVPNLCEKTMIPPKKLFHPIRFDMFKFDEKGFVPDYSTIERRVVVGLHPCEIHGLLTLDRVFGSAPPDPYYMELRKNSLIIGWSCAVCNDALCKSTNTDMIEEGFDLFFVDIGEFYLVWIGSSIGYDMIHEKEEFFDDKVTRDDLRAYIEWREKRNASFLKSFNFDNMPDVMDMTYASEVWNYFADKCISCGQCSMVCPTCNCYSVTDHFDVTNALKGRRERMWDSCMFADYSLVAGGHNFRGARADRLRLWYTHKLKAYGGEFGKPGCVGCGRCVETCPVDINVLTIAEALTSGEVPKK
jgi:sulfhydrogenase subunit beta (sulfur reductase)